MARPDSLLTAPPLSPGLIETELLEKVQPVIEPVLSFSMAPPLLSATLRVNIEFTTAICPELRIAPPATPPRLPVNVLDVTRPLPLSFRMAFPPSPEPLAWNVVPLTVMPPWPQIAPP